MRVWERFAYRRWHDVRASGDGRGNRKPAPLHVTPFVPLGHLPTHTVAEREVTQETPDRYYERGLRVASVSGMLYDGDRVT